MREVASTIPVAGPWITEREIEYVTDAVSRAWYSEANVYNERFEQALAEAVGRRHAIALPSCTSALHLALAALGIGPGDEVVVPDATWIASAAPVSYVGATPVFADVDRETWCLDAESFERAIGPRTKAAIVVDLYGGMPEMDALLAVADYHGVTLIEDAAEAIGASHRGRAAGSFGVAGTFSFHGSKTVTTGEGGALATDDDDLYERCLFLRDHGRHPGDKSFRSTEVAFKYRMSSLQAALGLAQVERLDELVDRKREIFSWYAEALPGVTLNVEGPGVRSSYWMVTAILGVESAAVAARLREEGIDTRPFFPPLSSLEAYAHLPARENPNAYALAPYGLNLPSGFDLTPERVARVADALEPVSR